MPMASQTGNSGTDEDKAELTSDVGDCGSVRLLLLVGEHRCQPSIECCRSFAIPSSAGQDNW